MSNKTIEKLVVTDAGVVSCFPIVETDKFKCRVCGVDCPIAPAVGRAICEEHCEDHLYKYEGADGHRCIHCFKPRPEDWFDE